VNRTDRVWWSAGDGGITVSLRVTPGAQRNEVIDAASDRLRVRIAARAVDGKANREMQSFIGELFGVRRSAVTLLRGERSRDKTLWIEGIDEPPPM
jgi:uncharacterized protein (TIGR00251 family)